ncbi:hypothetical protein MGL_2086 [Malassezia globosa CBS 7966]|uniref:HhH-GPD domain-containing protein n=1 Tax=Malassezia globosa (strain ATCC MYA-4612 / CBS 7966) TaxID=425265 RepID=A8Q0V2_MALGO|nr:uncharacterized protein MGL_2086 [Malassezia globosa CBS 7966]EDP43873.1 hypothetical protein MGL_2086 [Malassezia globosa CBS 7966]
MRLAQPDVESKLRSLGFGYRAKFLARTAQVLCERVSCGKDMKPSDVDHAVYTHLLSLRNCTYGEARAKLMELPGIGPKVAEFFFTQTCAHFKSMILMWNTLPTKQQRKWQE